MSASRVAAFLTRLIVGAALAGSLALVSAVGNGDVLPGDRARARLALGAAALVAAVWLAMRGGAARRPDTAVALPRASRVGVGVAAGGVAPVPFIIAWNAEAAPGVVAAFLVPLLVTLIAVVLPAGAWLRRRGWLSFPAALALALAGAFALNAAYGLVLFGDELPSGGARRVAAALLRQFPAFAATAALMTSAAWLVVMGARSTPPPSAAACGRRTGR